MVEQIENAAANNLYDNLAIDVDDVYRQFPIAKKAKDSTNTVSFNQSSFHRIYSNRLVPLKYRNYLWHFCRRTNLDQTWMDEFRIYWRKILKARPLWGPQDLYFLRNHYRIKFQHCTIVDSNSTDSFLEAWQSPELLYLLLHYVFKESIANQVKLLVLLKKFAGKFARSILEYGCSLAPVTTSYFEFFPLNRHLTFYLADIQTIAFHYGAYKFRNYPNVVPILLAPENDFQLDFENRIDVIFCLTVFEHLNKPLETVKKFHELLNRKGLLFFDYIKGTADGLDTKQGENERDPVLEFIQANFKVLYGNIDKNKDVGLTIVQKK